MTGRWKVDTKRTMSAFLLAANARLPIDQPDDDLLSLVQSYDHASCGERLPTEVQLVAPIESESGPDRPPGLMGIGGPKPGTDEPFAKPPEVPPRRVDWLSAAPARRPVDVATAAPRATSLPASFQDSDPCTSS